MKECRSVMRCIKYVVQAYVCSKNRRSISIIYNPIKNKTTFKIICLKYFYVKCIWNSIDYPTFSFEQNIVSHISYLTGKWFYLFLYHRFYANRKLNFSNTRKHQMKYYFFILPFYGGLHKKWNIPYILAG